MNSNVFQRVLEISPQERIVLRPYHEGGVGNFRNLEKHRCGEVVWIAELPKGSADDAYVEFEIVDQKLFANSFGGMRCEICLKDGKIISQKFVK